MQQFSLVMQQLPLAIEENAYVVLELMQKGKA
jgi:hypothetical protein